MRHTFSRVLDIVTYMVFIRALTFQNLCQRQCRRTLARSDLIPTILNFDVDSLVQHQHVATAVEQNYLGGRTWTKSQCPILTSMQNNELH